MGKADQRSSGYIDRHNIGGYRSADIEDIRPSQNTYSKIDPETESINQEHKEYIKIWNQIVDNLKWAKNPNQYKKVMIKLNYQIRSGNIDEFLKTLIAELPADVQWGDLTN